MDPTTCYRELELALRRDDRADAREYAEALRDWLVGGGFLPSGKTREECDELLARVFDPYGDKRDGAE